MRSRWFILEPIFWKLWPYLLNLTPHNFATGPHFVPLTQLWATKTGSKFVLNFLRNPECVRIFWVYTPKNFPIENFRVQSNLQKSSVFHWFPCPHPQKKYQTDRNNPYTYSHHTLHHKKAWRHSRGAQTELLWLTKRDVIHGGPKWPFRWPD